MKAYQFIAWITMFYEVGVMDRRDILLRAAYDLLKKCNESGYVEDAMSTIVFYDDAECDGTCLMEDIASHMGYDEE